MKREKKFAQGPWVPLGNSVRVGMELWHANSQMLSAEEIGRRETGRTANAHLIAAAPDILFALEAFLECWSDETGLSNPSYDEVAEAKEAIAKAYGDQT